MNTFGTRIHTALDVIKNLPIDALNERQTRLVSLIADIVNHETSDGDDTSHTLGCETQDYWNTLMIYTRDVGFKFLGAGHFSVAFSHDLLPGKVIKVGFKKEDSGAAYAAWCRMNQGRVGVPTIHAIARHAGCYTVVLDHLDEYCYHAGDGAASDLLDSYYNLAVETLHGRDPEIWDDYSMDLKQTMWDIRAFFVDIAGFDLHSGNVMVSSRGELVITDPVSWTKISRDKFQIDADELIEEIKAAAEREAEQRRINAKALAEARMAQRQDIRDEHNARQIMGRTHWRDVWLVHDTQPLRQIEMVKARQFHDELQFRVAAGMPLRCDLELDAQLQG